MNGEIEPTVNVAKRFKWIDSDTVRIVSIEGLEKIVDLKNGFREISYGAVPLFEKEDQTKNKHFYFNKEGLEIGDTYKRLIRKY